MSRQRLSYADLEPLPSTSNVPNPQFSSGATLSGEPPRKRMKTDSYPPASGPVNYMYARQPPFNGNSYSHTNQNGPAGNSPNRGKPKRPGNPSGVHWTHHWDAQAEGDMGGLAYDQSQSTRSVSGSNGNHFRPTNDGRFAQTANRQHPQARNAPHRPNTQAPFIGPVVPATSHAVNVNASGINGNNPNGEVSKKKKKRPKKAQNAEKSNEPREDTGNRNKKVNKSKSTVQFGHDWDDSALIDAWNAAEAQYKEKNGGKKWSLTPVKYSALWHDTISSNNIDQTSDAETSALDHDEDDQVEAALDHTEAPAAEGAFEDHGTQESPKHLNATSSVHASGTASESFVPLASPSLVGPPKANVSPLVSMGEAFQKAQDASYALGYWTAIYNYHHQLHLASTKNDEMANPMGTAADESIEYMDEGEAAAGEEQGDEDEDEEEEEEEEGAYEDTGGFVATQRQL